MIKEITVYTLICDNCGKDSQEDSEFIGWNNADFAWDCANQDDWTEDSGKHFCPDCYELDDNGVLIVKRKAVAE